jgi:hypothetical protein
VDKCLRNDSVSESNATLQQSRGSQWSDVSVVHLSSLVIPLSRLQLVRLGWLTLHHVASYSDTATCGLSTTSAPVATVGRAGAMSGAAPLAPLASPVDDTASAAVLTNKQKQEFSRPNAAVLAVFTCFLLYCGIAWFVTTRVHRATLPDLQQIEDAVASVRQHPQLLDAALPLSTSL